MQKICNTKFFFERNGELVSPEGWGTLSNMGSPCSLLTSQVRKIVTSTEKGLAETVSGCAMLKKYCRYTT